MRWECNHLLLSPPARSPAPPRTVPHTHAVSLLKTVMVPGLTRHTTMLRPSSCTGSTLCCRDASSLLLLEEKVPTACTAPQLWHCCLQAVLLEMPTPAPSLPMSSLVWCCQRGTVDPLQPAPPWAAPGPLHSRSQGPISASPPAAIREVRSRRRARDFI